MPVATPVFVMLPLDTVNADGVFHYASSAWFTNALSFLASSGVRGVAIDCWWGVVEKKPRQYDFSAYRQVCALVKRFNLQLQVVMSFHACGGNVNDTVQITLPPWVLECGKNDPDIFFTDRPRNGRMGSRNKECVSFFADEVKCLQGRSPIECYQDMMAAFAKDLSDMLGTVIEEIVIGMGPCGELRFPSYVESNGWMFPGVGEFQVYDRRAVASLARAAQEVGHPEWGRSGPDGVGCYNSLPMDTRFFTWDGGWQTPQGDFFLRWYSSVLKRHSQRLLHAAVRVFFPFMHEGAQATVRERGAVPVADLPTTPPLRRAGSCAAFGSRETCSTPGEAFFERSAPASSLAGLSGMQSRHSLPAGLCDLMSSDELLQRSPRTDSVSGRFPRAPSCEMLLPADAGLSGESTGTGKMVVPPLCPSPSDRAASAVGTAGGRSLSEGGSGVTPVGSHFGSMRSLWKSPRDEMPVLPESEPFKQDVPRRGGSTAAGGASAETDRTEMLSEAGDVMDAACQEVKTSSSSSLFSLTASECAAAPVRRGVLLSLKIAGVHWWYHTPSHAAELTAGYYNTSDKDGYQDIINICSDHSVGVILTCVEMSDAQHPPEALCGPEALLRQVRETAHSAGLKIAGENALACITGAGVNTYALDHIVKNTRSRYTLRRRASDITDRALAQHHYASNASAGCTTATTIDSAHELHGGQIHGPIPLPHSISTTPAVQKYFMQGGLHRSSNPAMRKATSWIDLQGCTSSNVVWTLSRLRSHGAHGKATSPRAVKPPSPCPSEPARATSNAVRDSDDRDQLRELLGGVSSQHADSGDAVAEQPSVCREHPGFLPPMRMFTFLRMSPDLLQPSHSGQWLHFMRHMNAGA